MQIELCLSTSKVPKQPQNANGMRIFSFPWQSLSFVTNSQGLEEYKLVSYTKATGGHHSEILRVPRIHLICNDFWPHLTFALYLMTNSTSPFVESVLPIF